jgi:hypothetical protein
MRSIVRTIGGIAVVAALAVVARPASGMPNFARKYGWDCSMCHSTIPRLNEFGFQFRKAGYRPPNEIGVEQKVKFEDIFAARIQAQFASSHRNDQGVSTNSNQLTLTEVTLYPISGSFGKYWSSLTELSILNEDFVEIENAYVRHTRGNEKAWFSARIGIFHPFEGYGASDRPMSLARPFIQTEVANHNGSAFFTPWNFDQAGLELAYVIGRTSFSATLFNGLIVENDGGAYKGFPAAGGNLQKSKGFTDKNSKDIQLFVNHILKDDGSGISAYFYKGSIDVPIPGTTPDAFGPATSFDNSFYRAAIYGSWQIVPKLGLQAGYQYGQDHYYDTATQSSDNTFNSRGFFGEVFSPISDHLTVGARYDEFIPSTSKDQNKKNGVTLYGNIPLNDGFQAIAQYQHVQTQRVGKDDLKDDNFQIRIIWIW